MKHPLYILLLWLFSLAGIAANPPEKLINCQTTTTLPDGFTACHFDYPFGTNFGFDVLDNDTNADSTTLTYLNDINPVYGSVVVSGSALVWTSATVVSGDTIRFSYSVSSGPGCTPDTSNVTAVFLDDVATQPDSGSTTTNQCVQLDVLSNDLGHDASTLTFQNWIGNTGGTVSVVNQNLEFCANATPGIYQFAYQICADEYLGCCSTDTVTVTVADGCQTATALPDGVIMCNPDLSVGDRFGFPVLDNDTNADSTTLTYLNDINPVYGSVVVSGNILAWTATPAAFGDTIRFSYSVSSGPGCTPDTSNVTAIFLDDVATQPDSGSTTTNQCVQLDVLSNDSGYDASTLTFQNWIGNTGGTVSVANQNLEFCANATPGTYQFAYQICADEYLGCCSTDTVTVTVAEGCQATTTLPDGFTTCHFDYPFGTNFGFDVLDNDTNADSTTLTYLNDINPVYGSVVVSGSTLVWTSATVVSGDTIRFSYSVSSGPGCTPDTNEVVAVFLDDVATQPDNGSTTINQCVQLDVLSNDSGYDASTLAFQNWIGSTGGTVSVVNQNLEFCANATPGTYQFAYQICADEYLGCCSTDTVTVTVTGNCQPTTALPDGVIMCNPDLAEGNVFGFPVLDNDTNADSTTLTYLNDINPVYGSVVVSGNILAWTATPAAFGDTIRFSYSVSSGPGCTPDTSDVTAIFLDDVATQPDSGGICASQCTRFDVLTNDAGYDSSTLSFQNWIGSVGGTVSVLGQELEFCANATPGRYQFTYQICADDYLGCCSIDTVTVEVFAAPVVNNDDFTLTEFCSGNCYNIDVLANDLNVDPNTLVYVGGLDPGMGGALSNNGQFELCLTSDANGELFFEYAVTNGTCAYAMGRVDFQVSTAPQASFSYSIEGFEVTFTNTSIGSELYNWSFGDSNGSDDINPTYTYQDNGSYEVCLVAFGSDPESSCNGQYCEFITIGDGCPVPSTTTDVVNVCLGDCRSSNVLLNDTDVDPSTISIATNLDPADGMVTVDPATFELLICLTDTATGPLSFTYQVCSGPDPCECRIETVTVNINPPPIASFGISSNGSVFSFTDQSTGSISERAWTFGDGNASIEESPQHTYAQPGSYQVCLSVTDANGCTASGCLDILILPPNCDSPVTQTDTVYLCSGSCGTINVLTNDSNVSAATLTGPSEFGSGAGTINLDTINQLFTVCAGDTSGTFSFEYRICSNENECNCGVETVTVIVETSPSAVFLMNPNDLTVDFANISTGNIIGYQWLFGDGSGTTQQEPTHTYNAPGTYEVCLEVFGANGCSDMLCTSVTVQLGVEGIEVVMQLGLEGAFDSETGLMNPGLLNSNLLPISDPYHTDSSPADETNEDVLARIGDQAIIDWVRVQFRSSNDPEEILFERSGLLQADGFVVGSNGDAFIIPDLTEGEYFVLVYQRNHLPIVTDAPFEISDQTPNEIDFFNGVVQTYGGENAMKSIAGKRLLFSGDANGDGQVNAIDNAEWVQQNGTAPGYGDGADFNLDGQKNATDRILWIQNNPVQAQLPFSWQ